MYGYMKSFTHLLLHRRVSMAAMRAMKAMKDAMQTRKTSMTAGETIAQTGGLQSVGETSGL